MNIEISLTIIAISLLVLVIFAIVAIFYLIKLLKSFQKTACNLETKVAPILDYTQKIAASTSTATDRIKDNVELTVPFFYSVSKVSSLMADYVTQFQNDVKTRNVMHNFEVRKEKVNAGDWAEWLASGIVLFQNLRK